MRPELLELAQSQDASLASGFEEAGPERLGIFRLQAANGESLQDGLGDNGGDALSIEVS